MNAQDLDDLKTFALKVAAVELKARPASPARTVEVRVLTVTDADPLEQT